MSRHEGDALRLGRWQDVLAGVFECDALICDPPYSFRVHSGHNKLAKASASERIEYSSLSPEDVTAFVASWAPRTKGWMACMTSHDLVPAWTAAYAAAGRLAFAPVPCVTIGGAVRMAGDGPASWAVYLMVSRPRTKAMAKWGALPGAYVERRAFRRGGGGRNKSMDLMRAIVRDYSRPGDLVCDPCAGYATTGVAALTLGRRFVGAEVVPDVFERGRDRLADVQAVDLFGLDCAAQHRLKGAE